MTQAQPVNALALPRGPLLIGDKRCETCKFSAPPADQRAAATGLLDCRRYPPQVVVIAQGQALTTFPVVSPDTVCGEFLQKLSS